jgi:phosphate uptake regulator
MARYDDELKALRKAAHEAEKAMRALPDEAWADKEARTRCLRVLAYACVALDASSGDLVSDQARQAITNALAGFSENPASVAEAADPPTSTLVDAIALLPIARGREVEQAVKDAAANFQRSAQQRLNALRRELDTAKSEIASLGDTIQERGVELGTTIDQRTGEANNRIEELQSSFTEQIEAFERHIAQEREALSEFRTRQTAVFEEAEEHRIVAARDRLAEAQEELDKMQASAMEEVNERVAEIRRMEIESSELVGAIGLAGTAERYGEEAQQQKDAADRWRRVTVGLAILALVGVVYAITQRHTAVETFTAKLSLSIILGGIATYAGGQSAAHRRREQHARGLQLELTAFAPFIEPLTPEQKEEERVIMTRKTFGKTTAIESANEPGPTALSFLLRRREKAAAEE